MKKSNQLLFYLLILFFVTEIVIGQVLDRPAIENTYPWCIVAYDSLERTPVQRINMIKDLGFTKYAYDWRDKHLHETYEELKLSMDNDIEILGLWLWLNAKRDTIGRLSRANEVFFNTVEKLELKSTFWVGLSPNFFESLTDDEALNKAVKIIDFISQKAAGIGCNVALYNHSGWFADPYNQLKIIKSLPQHSLKVVYNFHHAHNDIDDFPKIAKAIEPYLIAVNLNGMEKDGNKILTIGKGTYEMQMINSLKESGFNGPWGIMGHVENVDVQKVLAENIDGLKFILGI